MVCTLDKSLLSNRSVDRDSGITAPAAAVSKTSARLTPSCLFWYQWETFRTAGDIADHSDRNSSAINRASVVLMHMMQ